MPHMPATGVSGLDLYGEDRRFFSLGAGHSAHPTTRFRGDRQGLERTTRTYRMYLPLYNGVNTLKIGVPQGSEFEPLAPRPAKPLVFYGTSIMHGACASRPGMAIPALLGRMFDLPTINLGFSGNGKMDPEIGHMLAKLDPAVYCIDCLPNMNPELVRQRAVPLVRTLRRRGPIRRSCWSKIECSPMPGSFPRNRSFTRESSSSAGGL